MYNQSFWRKYPNISTNVYTLIEREICNKQIFVSWLKELSYCRIFIDRDPASSHEQRVSRLIPNAHASRILNLLISKKEPFTILLNNVETVSLELINIRSKLKVPYSWRVDDIVATFSLPGSGIGYHAGHEDGFIVQMVGSRRWKVWDSCEIQNDLRAEILINRPEDNSKFIKPKTLPILDVILNPGDVLYIPPFFPHEGVTQEESLSIAFGWKGIAYFHFLALFNPTYFNSLKYSDLTAELFALVPDYTMANTTHITTIATQITEKILRHVTLEQKKKEIIKRLCHIMLP